MFLMVSICGHPRAGTILATAVSLTGLLWLAGCEQQPYPTSSQIASEAPKPPPLAGAPSYAPPPRSAPQAYARPEAPYPPPPRVSTGVAIVAMAPIPNPGDPGSEGYYEDRHIGHHGHRTHAPTPSAVKTATLKAHASAPLVVAQTPLAPRPHGVAPKTAPPKAVIYAAKSPPAPKPAFVAAKPEPPKGYAGAMTPTGPVKPYVPPKDYKPVSSPAAMIKPAPKPAPVVMPAPPSAAADGDRAAHVAALQSALADAISKGAVLAAPERFTANQPADVSLTIPAGFADAVRIAAQKVSLSDAAATVNVAVVLSGADFSVTPDETQSQPLTVGQPTVFRWTVTAQPGAKGPLHADISADLLGSGSDTLALGSVQKQAGLGVKATPRIIGAAILFLILALAVVWLARGRGPARSATARRASQAARSTPADLGAAGS
jgi:hypothetical protein